MRRFILILLAGLLVFAMTGCVTVQIIDEGSGDNSGKQGNGDIANDNDLPENNEVSRSTDKTQPDLMESTSQLYPVMNGNEKWGYIDFEGNLVIDYIYDHAYFFIDGAASVGIGDKDGLIGPDGKFLIEPVYDFCGNISEGWAHIVIEEGGKSRHGFANINGDVLYNDDFNNNTGIFSEGLASFEKNGKYGYVDTKGRIVIEPQYDYAYDFSEGLAMVAGEDLKCGYINKQGEIVIPFSFDSDPIDGYNYQGFSNGMAGVYIKGKYGFINKNGDYVIEPRFEYIRGFSDGVALVCENGLYGYIDETGEYAIEPQFGHAASFQDGYAYARLPEEGDTESGFRNYDNSGYGFIDKSGKFVTDTNLLYEDGGGYTFLVEWVTGFDNGLARVAVMDGNASVMAYMNKKGETVWRMDK